MVPPPPDGSLSPPSSPSSADVYGNNGRSTESLRCPFEAQGVRTNSVVTSAGGADRDSTGQCPGDRARV